MQKKFADILKTTGKYNVAGMLWIEYEGKRAFGPGRVQLLQGIENTGSINKAAKAMGMSYKKAWNMISELNEQFAEPMVITQSGGKDGGGSVLTDAAKVLIKYHQELRGRFLKFLEKETNELTK